MFQDFDKTKCNHVTKTQFVRVLNLLKIDVSADILSLLLKKYMDRGNADEVNYFEFINDVDRPEDMFGAGRDFNHSYDYFSVTDPRKVEDQIIKIEPEDVNDLLARIRKEVSEKRIRLQEFFRDFDRLRSGNITVPQLRIGMNMAKIHLSKAEFELLTTHYASSKVGMVAWRQFCDEVDEVFTKKNLEKDVTVEVARPDLTTKYGQSAPPKADKSLAAKLVDKFKDKLRRERLDAKSFFQSWDRHNRFKVSPKQFRQVLATFGFELTEPEADALCKYYANQSGEIEYLNFLSDSNPDTPVQLEETKSTYRSKSWKFDGVSDYETLMAKIKGIVKKGRIRLLEFFQDHDSLRKGTIAYMKFKGVLRSQKIEITDKEYEILLQRYTSEHDPNLVDYVTFNEEMEGIFTKKGLEKAPTAKVDDFKPPSIIDPDDVLTDAEEKVLEECLVRIGTECKNRRLLLKPFFQDKDKINCGVVANSRFRSIFDFLKLYITDEEYKIINKRFVANAPNEINYMVFEKLLKTYSGDDKPF
jgi:Ca2+-binding EF-hand superfamily protein